MSHTPNDLAAEFPQDGDRIAALRQSNAHFARIVDEYNDINKEVYLAESNVEPTDSLHEGEMRKKRMQLKDEIWRMLSAETS